jgi:hypothetical protein
MDPIHDHAADLLLMKPSLSEIGAFNQKREPRDKNQIPQRESKLRSESSRIIREAQKLEHFCIKREVSELLRPCSSVDHRTLTD